MILNHISLNIFSMKKKKDGHDFPKFLILYCLVTLIDHGASYGCRGRLIDSKRERERERERERWRERERERERDVECCSNIVRPEMPPMCCLCKVEGHCSLLTPLSLPLSPFLLPLSLSLPFPFLFYPFPPLPSLSLSLV